MVGIHDAVLRIAVVRSEAGGGGEPASAGGWGGGVGDGLAGGRGAAAALSCEKAGCWAVSNEEGGGR